MGFVNTFTASGQGSLSLGGVQDVSEIAALVQTMADLASVDGFSPVRRLHHQAWYGLGITPVGGPTSGVVVIVWDKFVHIEAETTLLGAFNHLGADTLYWDVQPGGVMYFEVDWP
jgi:hypothetical protein